MNLAQVIHQRWAAATTLTGLLPASRVHTGIGAEATMPYAVISKQSDRPLTRHHDGSAVDLIGVRIEVFNENYDAGAAVVHEIKAAFDRTDFALAGSDSVLNMLRSNDRESQGDDGVWQFTVDFDCTVYLESGV